MQISFQKLSWKKIENKDGNKNYCDNDNYKSFIILNIQRNCYCYYAQNNRVQTIQIIALIKNTKKTKQNKSNQIKKTSHNKTKTKTSHNTNLIKYHTKIEYFLI